MSDFTHLHVHSEFSLLDGMSQIKKLVERAQQLNMDALAITDHGVMYGAIDFYQAAKEAGIKPIIGVEAYVALNNRQERIRGVEGGYYHLVLLARNRTGYHNLIRLTTEAHLNGYYYKPRIDKNLLANHSAGLICLSACASGEVPRLLQDGNYEGAKQTALWYREVFGPENYFLEIQEHGIAELSAFNPDLVRLSRETGIPLVATNDSHYIQDSDAEADEILLCIGTNDNLANPKHFRLPGESFFLKSAEEMAHLFPDLPEAIRNTRHIAEMCELELDFSRLLLPEIELPAGETAISYLRRLCEAGLPRRYPVVTDAVRARLEYELDVIEQTGFPMYILIVWDLAQEARRREIPFGVRGSAASSIVCYLINITDIDPLAWELAFERFLNIERKSMPDIDMDFADSRRQEMIDYAVQKYGRDHVAQIITFGTLGARAAIRDVGRVLSYPLSEVDRIARLVPTLPVGITIDKALEQSADFRREYETDEAVRRLVDTARRLEGISRHASTHAAGVVISKDPLVEHVPLQRVSKGGNEALAMTQYHMGVLEKIGLLKMDFLGLANLTILGEALKLLAGRGIKIDLQAIPLDDAKTFDLLGRGETTAIFQLEGQGMRRYVQELKPNTIQDLAAIIALYRPGPMASIPQYIRAKHGQIPVTYLHPKLKPILEPTYGVLVYQDQVLFIARAIAGYSLGRADILRRAMGKKKPEEMKREKAHFLEGAQQNGIPQEAANQIWDLIEPFAGYGFNAAHAACYAMIAYQTAYLKANYPVEYMTAVLESAAGNIEKVATAIAECRRMGIAVLPPHINQSDVSFTIEEQGEEQSEEQSQPGSSGPALAIRFGLMAIKNVGEGPCREIIAARDRGGPFTSIEDFCQRVGPQVTNKRVLESLIKAGALDLFGRRESLLAVLDQLAGITSLAQQMAHTGQLSLFGAAPVSARPQLRLPDVPPVPDKDKLAWEKELLGLYFSEHPLQKVMNRLGNKATFCGEVDESLAGQKVIVVGMVTGVRRITTKKGDLMAFVQLEDIQGSIEVTVFPKVFGRTEAFWQVDQIVQVQGKVEVRDEKVQIIADDVSGFEVNPASADKEAEESSDQQDREMTGELPQAVGSPPAALQETPAGYEAKPATTKPPSPAEVAATAPAQSTRVAVTSTPSAAPPARSTGNNHRERGSNGTSPGLKFLHIAIPTTGDQENDTNRLQAVWLTLQRYPGADRFHIYLMSGQRKVKLRVPAATTGYCPQLEKELAAILGSGQVKVEVINGLEPGGG